MRQEIFRFLLAGGSCFLLELATLWILTELGGINYLESAAIAFTLAVAINYEMCSRWVWSSARRSRKAIAIFISTSVIGLGINQLCMYFFVEFVELHYMIAKIFSTIVVTAWNFFTKRMALSA